MPETKVNFSSELRSCVQSPMNINLHGIYKKRETLPLALLITDWNCILSLVLAKCHECTR